jgi:hypothetical protein
MRPRHAHVIGSALAIAACARPTRAPAPLDEAIAARGPDVRDRAYELSWRGARIGEAREREVTTAAGVTLTRHERILVSRAGHVLATEVDLAVTADPTLIASAVTWRARADGAEHTARAVRDAQGWQIERDGAIRRAPADAVPDELVPLLVRRDGGFAGTILITGRGFAVAHGQITRVGADRWRADLRLAGGALGATILTDGAGDPLTTIGDDGVVARRADEAALAAPFDPPDAIDAGAITVSGAIAPRGPIALRLRGVTRPPPPSIPGQAIVADGDTWRIELDRAVDRPAAADTDRVAAIRALAAQVAVEIRPDLATSARALADARVATAGDCTTHALAFAARALERGIDARVVTGFRLDGDRLIRHRWALAWTGARWLAVDPSFPAGAPARLLGLHVGAPGDDLDLADLAFDGVGADAEVAPTPPAQDVSNRADPVGRSPRLR